MQSGTVPATRVSFLEQHRLCQIARNVRFYDIDMHCAGFLDARLPLKSRSRYRCSPLYIFL